MTAQSLSLARLDRPVTYGALSRVAASLAGVVTLAAVALGLDPESQGYFYAFGNVLALQIFAELGLGTVLTQFASHEWALRARPEARSRLASLGRFGVRWFALAGVWMALGLGL